MFESRSISIAEKRFQSARGGELLAIKNLEFEVPENQFTCIVGPSGCGKTTTLKIILGLDKQYQGEIPAFTQSKTAAVFQEPRLLPWRTVRQNVELCMASAASPDDHSLTDSTSYADLQRLYEMTGLETMLDFYPAELSLGLARRVSLVRAFAIQPALLILDEPFVSLDENTAGKLRKLLLSIWAARPTTVLMVTHNLHEAAELADTIHVLGPRPTRVLESVIIDKPRGERSTDDCKNIVSGLGDIVGQPIEEQSVADHYPA